MKKTDKELGDIGAEVAFEKQKLLPNSNTFQMCVSRRSTFYDVDEPARTAFAAAVAAEVRKESRMEYQTSEVFQQQREDAQEMNAAMVNSQEIATLRAKLAEAEKRLAALELPPLGKEDEILAVASVSLSRTAETTLSRTHTLHWRRHGVSDPDKMRGIALEAALNAKPGFSVDSIIVSIVGARAGKEGGGMKTKYYFLLPLSGLPVVPFMFWLGGFDFNERGLTAAACAIWTLILCAFLGFIGFAIDEKLKP
jgi:hypothetical protein